MTTPSEADLRIAREAAAQECEKYGTHGRASNYRAGVHDAGPTVQSALRALALSREAAASGGAGDAKQPSAAAMQAAVELEIQACLGRVTTRAIGEQIEAVAQALAAAPASSSEVQAIRALSVEEIESIICLTIDIKRGPGEGELTSNIPEVAEAIFARLLQPAKAEGDAWRPIYTSAVGEAGQKYLESLRGRSSTGDPLLGPAALPGSFLWYELFDAMLDAAAPPPVSKEGR